MTRTAAVSSRTGVDLSELESNTNGSMVRESEESESIRSYDGQDDGTESPTEDDPDNLTVDSMTDSFSRRTADKTAAVDASAAWYDQSGAAQDGQRELGGPFGLVIRQVRNGQMEKWQDLESLPIENKSILDDEEVAFELERVRIAAQNDIQALLDVASDLWEKTFQKANDLDQLHVENDELELQVRLYETNIRVS